MKVICVVVVAGAHGKVFFLSIMSFDFYDSRAKHIIQFYCQFYDRRPFLSVCLRAFNVRVYIRSHKELFYRHTRDEYFLLVHNIIYL